ncbi:MAG: serine/threonine protein kinase [Mycobacterium sp.]|uniref:serine/threonine-protein kinase n=1 Tax=Mycobacterium sp. TaxID=1785 RepID=UPI001ECB5233|nr:serine/threonine-protein kinase [Mycobacterium sp.]MBV8788601.1 serine/threonine protein kinase [Mycobacterium sp.]
MALPSGASFAGYIVSRSLGSGVTGEVYLVQDPRSSRWQALKVLSQEMSTNPEFRRRFREETPIAANLAHPHIVEVHERGQFEGQLYIAMEYIEGSSVAQLIADRFPAVSPVGDVLAIVTAIAAALDYAHQHGMTHRDVKPDKILLTGRGEAEQRVLLTDFGIVPPVDPNAADVPVRAVAYAAPEQLSGAEVDGHADQYGLAATAFHLLTGAPPVVGSARHATGPRLSEQRPELERLDSVFARALAPRPADRFGTCGDFATAASEAVGVSRGAQTDATDDKTDDKEKAGSRFRSRFGAKASQPSEGEPQEAAVATPVATLTEPAAGPVPLRRRPRKFLLWAAAAVVVVAVLALGVVIGRKTYAPRGAVAHTPGASVAAGAPPAPAAAPTQLDGSYRLQAERTKQTYNSVADPNPPDVTTWWAFRSLCTPNGCNAAATQLDDTDHVVAKAPAGASLFLQFTDGQWQSAPMSLDFPCVASDGSQATQTTSMVVSLRPQSQGDFVGEETVTVQTNECGQQSAVVRIPTVANRSGEVPPAVSIPDPSAAGGAPASPRPR